jgi:TolB-like protein
VNRSPDHDDEYFSDGLTEEIISDLASVKALSVISRTSAMRFKGSDKDVRTIGRELGVRYVLEGSVRKAGSSLRITAQLIDAEADSQLWSEKYGGTMDDVFEVQERVSREIVKALGVKLSSDEDRRLAQRPIQSPRAFELYLEARQLLRGLGTTTERGKRLVHQAIEIEGRTPPLLWLLAWADVGLVKAGMGDPAILVECAVQADTLLAMAPEAHYGHSLHGYIAFERGRHPDAVRHFVAALEREPSDADSLFWLCVTYWNAGCAERAEPAAKRMMATDPLSPLSWAAPGSPSGFSALYGGVGICDPRAGAGSPELHRALDDGLYLGAGGRRGARRRRGPLARGPRTAGPLHLATPLAGAVVCPAIGPGRSPRWRR